MVVTQLINNRARIKTQKYEAVTDEQGRQIEIIKDHIGHARLELICRHLGAKEKK